MAPGKKKGLTLGILLGKAGKPEEDPMEDTESLESMMDDEDDSEDTEDELPPGLVEAVSEFRNAEDDESAAKALMHAITLCGDGY